MAAAVKVRVVDNDFVIKHAVGILERTVRCGGRTLRHRNRRRRKTLSGKLQSILKSITPRVEHNKPGDEPNEIPINQHELNPAPTPNERKQEGPEILDFLINQKANQKHAERYSLRPIKRNVPLPNDARLRLLTGVLQRALGVIFEPTVFWTKNPSSIFSMTRDIGYWPWFCEGCEFRVKFFRKLDLWAHQLTKPPRN